MNGTKWKRMNSISISFLLFCTCVIVARHNRQHPYRYMTLRERVKYFNKYFGSNLQHIFLNTIVKDSQNIVQKTPTSSAENISVANGNSYTTVVERPPVYAKTQDNKSVHLDETLGGLDSLTLNLAAKTGSVSNSSGNQMRGWLFNTFEKISTEVEQTTQCDDKPQLVLNKSVACDYNSLKKVTLSNNQLTQFMSDEGGNFVKDYMATDTDSARNNFKNLIAVTENYEDLNFKRHPSDWMWDYNLTKSKLLEQLELSHAQLMVQMRPGGNMSEPYKPSSWNNWVNDTASNVNALLSKLGKASLLSKFLPSKHMYPLYRRHKRATDGLTTTMEYCQNRGSETTDGYLHMCTMCAHTTTLPDDKFPRILNEALCHSTDSGCLFVGRTPHGSCRQNIFHMNMLRKKPGSCMMVIHDGAIVLTDEWELYSQPIRVSCECLVNKRSPVAKNVNPN